MVKVEEFYQTELEWCDRRLQALEKIEVRLKEMRELAAYAASRVLNKEDAAQIQEWMNVLKTEVEDLNEETAGGFSAWDGFLRSSDKQNYGSCRFYS